MAQSDFIKSKSTMESLQKAYLRYNFSDIQGNAFNGVYADVQGRMYGGWIDLAGRSNSYSEGGLIQNPVGIIESIIRDMVFAEYNLEASSVFLALNNSYFEFNGTTHSLLSTVNDYYNNAYLVNVSQNWCEKVTDYTGSNKRLLIPSASLGLVGDKCYITNTADGMIDTTSFDSAMSNRSSWGFAFSLDQQIEAYSLLQQIAFESQVAIHKNYNKYKVTPLTTGTTVGTLSMPLIERNGNLMMEVFLTDIDEIFTEYVINYGFLFQENKYIKTLYCNKDEASSTVSSALKTRCKNAETNYRVQRKLEIYLDFVYLDATALEFLTRMVINHTQQGLIVGYIGDIKNHIKYEKGDLVKINVPSRIPASKNNSSQFMIVKQDLPFKRGGEVILKLVEILE